MTNFKDTLKQICRRIERQEFAIDVALAIGGLNPAIQRALEGLSTRYESDSDDDDDESGQEFEFRGESKHSLDPHLVSKIHSTWELAVRGAFATLTNSDVWPPVGAPAGSVAAALQFDPSAMQCYTGLKIVRPGASNGIIRCTQSFHGKPRHDVVVLNGAPDFAYDDAHTMEYGYVHCFFTYKGAGLASLLKWGAVHFNVVPDGGGGAAASAVTITQFTQFTLLQRYRPSSFGNAKFPLRNYAAKVLSADYETECVAVVHCRARPYPWFHGTMENDMQQKKGAIFCTFK